MSGSCGPHAKIESSLFIIQASVRPPFTSSVAAWGSSDRIRLCVGVATRAGQNSPLRGRAGRNREPRGGRRTEFAFAWGNHPRKCKSHPIRPRNCRFHPIPAIKSTQRQISSGTATQPPIPNPGRAHPGKMRDGEVREASLRKGFRLTARRRAAGRQGGGDGLRREGHWATRTTRAAVHTCIRVSGGVVAHEQSLVLVAFARGHAEHPHGRLDG